MTYPTRLCRIAYLTDDIDAHVKRCSDVLGFTFQTVELGDFPLKVRIGEHGFEPLQTTGFSFAPIEGPFIEIALAVDNADKCKDAMEADGYKPIAVNHIDVTDNDEYLFGPDFHGIPVMVAFEGDQEATLSAEKRFLTLEEAPAPKLGLCVLLVDDLDKAAADFGRKFDMQFTEADPQGFGGRALTGAHRVKLVERGKSKFVSEFTGPLAAFEIMYDNVEVQKARFEAAGCRVLQERDMPSGGKAYYFGSQFEGIPIGIYPAADDDAMRGLG